MWREIKKVIRRYHNFIFTTHVNPDGDGVGAACAMTEILLQMNKKVRFVCDSPIPRKFNFLDYHGTHEVYNPENNYQETQVLIIFDTHKKDRIGRLAKLADRPDIVTICIDHHEATEIFTDYQAINPHACSVGAMIYAFYKESGLEFNIRAANGIYTSVVCDTGRFCHSTGRTTHKIAEDCIKLGVDPDLMYSRLFQHVTLAETKIFARALQGMETFLGNQVAIQQIRLEDCDEAGEPRAELEHIDLDYIHAFNNSIEDIRCFILLRELPNNHVRVSLRSKADLDISSIVHSLGGGGHPHAAGLNWEGSLDDVKRELLKLFQELFERPKPKVSQIKNSLALAKSR